MRSSEHAKARIGLLFTSALVSFLAGGLGLSSPQPTAIGIDLSVVDGRPDTLRLIRDHRYRIDQIDLAATDDRAADDALHALMNESVFAALDWRGLKLAFSDTARGLDGSAFLREIYRDARWMTGAHRFIATPLDADGDPAASPILLASDADTRAIPRDDFPTRRPAVIRDHRDGRYHAEALLQLRNGRASETTTFLMTGAIRALELAWEGPATMPGGIEPAPISTTRIPIIEVFDPPFAYGFHCDIALIDPPPAITPGTEIEIELTFRDGTGTRLHPEGSLPTYNEFRRGLSSGLRYYDFYPSVLYFKDKNKEGVMLFALFGPEDRARQIYTEISLEQLTEPQQVVAEPIRDGYSCIWQGIPPANVLFAGLSDSTAWDTPIADRIRFRIPPDALPGRYQVIGKARRAYLSESSLVTATLRFDVTALTQTEDNLAPTKGPLAVSRKPNDEQGTALPWVGKCKDCHSNDFDLSGLLH